MPQKHTTPVKHVTISPSFIIILSKLADFLRRKMRRPNTFITLTLNFFIICGWAVNAFVVRQSVSSCPFTSLKSKSFHLERKTARNVSTVDPTTALSDVLGDLVQSPAVLAVPILAAVSVAALLVWFIISYANPEDEDK